MPSLERKQEYTVKMKEYLQTYKRVLLVDADNVGSAHMQSIRKSLRGKAVLLMGKNTLMRRVLRELSKTDPKYEMLLPHIVKNIGLVFTNEELTEIRDIIKENRVGAPAKAGAIAPCDVVVPAGNTGLEPTQTSFLQALNIATKISRGQIEILNNVNLLKEGDKVGSSEAALLAKLNIRPFSYGLVLRMLFDEGSVFHPKVLDISDNDLLAVFSAAVGNIAAFSLATGFATAAAVPHIIVDGYKNLLAIVAETNYVFERAQKVKDYLENPEAFAAAAAAAAPAAAEAKEEKAAEPEPEEEEESDDDLGGGLFGDDDGY